MLRSLFVLCIAFDCPACSGGEKFFRGDKPCSLADLAPPIHEKLHAMPCIRGHHMGGGWEFLIWSTRCCISLLYASIRGTNIEFLDNSLYQMW